MRRKSEQSEQSTIYKAKDILLLALTLAIVLTIWALLTEMG